LNFEFNSGRHGDFVTEYSGAQPVRARIGQNVSGYAVGILYLDGMWYPKVPGNVASAATYDFPVLFQAVRNVALEKLDNGAVEVFPAVLEAAQALQQEGVRTITSACGYFGHYQKMLADAMDVPVCMSCLVQIHWIRTILKKGSKIGILTASDSSMTTELLRKSDVTDSSDLIIKGLQDGSCFQALFENAACIDNAGIAREVVAAAQDLAASDDQIAAILMTCSDIPPYASAVQAATGLPVFDYITMIRWLYHATVQKPYSGIY